MTISPFYNRDFQPFLAPAPRDISIEETSSDVVARACFDIYSSLRNTIELRLLYPEGLTADYKIKESGPHKWDVEGMGLCVIDPDEDTFRISADSLECICDINENGALVNGTILKGNHTLLSAREKLTAAYLTIAEEISEGVKISPALTEGQKYDGLYTAIQIQQDFFYINDLIDRITERPSAHDMLRQSWQTKAPPQGHSHYNFRDIVTLGQFTWEKGVSRIRAAGLNFTWTVGNAGPDNFKLEEGSFETLKARGDIIASARTLAEHHAHNFSIGKPLQEHHRELSTVRLSDPRLIQ